MEQKQNGKKVATILISTIVVASILVMVIITAFYKFYDPTKYGRNNGGIDLDSNPSVNIIEENQTDEEK